MPARSTFLLLLWCGFTVLILCGTADVCAAQEKLAWHTHDTELPPFMDRLKVTMEWLTALWFFALGCVIGSFLNVVIYRLPAGLSLNHPPSRCPKCEVPIRKFDNIPIFGWLRLRGRCRSCKVWIPIRYPLVELTVGLLFLFLLYWEALSGGANIANYKIPPYSGVVWIIWHAKWDIIGLYLYHLWWATTLLAAVLMVYDGHAIPRPLWITTILAGLIPACLLPHPVLFIDPIPEWLSQLVWRPEFLKNATVGYSYELGIGLSGPVDALFGLLAGLGLGLVATSTMKSPGSRGILFVLGTSGLFFGWQFVVPAALLGGCLALIASLLAGPIPTLQRLPLVVYAGIAAFVQLLFWRMSEGWSFWPDYKGWAILIEQPWWNAPAELSLGIAAIVAIGVWLLTGIIGNHSLTDDSPESKEEGDPANDVTKEAGSEESQPVGDSSPTST
ncbi:A24 family peptidase [Calycomorphotria hydatis]|uniref:Type 4 prepilin-like proteins leader peptide-processing enzyme n=1 Tax=Calycomorphotria hydatis TaxID=2528027 RepID=A0A517T6H4_9PLAN|nr:prepilin peptidase [Calycomorphotria hydatis]QDT63982.1 Type 4 prepilin-like proteins leader peptide-processing enzyme [Calycomorphotria hydatis]